MAAQKGKDMLIKLGDGDTPETFVSVAGLRSASLAFNAQTVDITNADSSGAWRELLAGGGVRSATISGAGLFKDADADELVRAAFFNGAQHNWQVIVPDFGTMEGPFDITGLQYEAAYDGEVRVSLTLNSAGALSFTAA
jgi:TP901-1 family phage major tail protein